MLSNPKTPLKVVGGMGGWFKCLFKLGDRILKYNFNITVGGLG